MATEKNGKKTGKDPVTGQFVKGNKFGGNIKGNLHFKTLFNQAIEKIAKSNDIDPESIEKDLIVKAITEARKGNFKYYQDLMDRVYGRAPQSLDVTSDGEPLKIIFDSAFENDKRD